VEGFDRSKNGLFEINVHVTPQGLIFANFDCSEDGPVPFKEWYGGLEDELDEVNFDEYEYHSSYELDGQFNWKTLSKTALSEKTFFMLILSFSGWIPRMVRR
jgi:hypothetical protein